MCVHERDRESKRESPEVHEKELGDDNYTNLKAGQIQVGRNGLESIYKEGANIPEV